MIKLSKKNKAALKVLIFCLVISFFTLARKNCVPDYMCDPDYMYGGCSDICEYELPRFWSVIGRTIGFYFLIAMGGILGKDMFEES